jgi:hypothetical protein
MSNNNMYDEAQEDRTRELLGINPETCNHDWWVSLNASYSHIKHCTKCGKQEPIK